MIRVLGKNYVAEAQKYRIKHEVVIFMCVTASLITRFEVHSPKKQGYVCLFLLRGTNKYHKQWKKKYLKIIFQAKKRLK